MKLFRYRRPPIKAIPGITKAKKRIKTNLGLTALRKPFRAWTNTKRRIKLRADFCGDAGGLIRVGVP
jgi:hypothetical protein